jgi:hypothetical protein
MFIPDTGSEFSIPDTGSEFSIPDTGSEFSIPDQNSGSQIRIKEFRYGTVFITPNITLKLVSKLSEI